jgi:hypothetical protein
MSSIEAIEERGHGDSVKEIVAICFDTSGVKTHFEVDRDRLQAISSPAQEACGEVRPGTACLVKKGPAPDVQSQQSSITHKVYYTPWERAINLIYESDYTGDATEFEDILKDTPELLSHVDGGFGLVHFLFDSSSGPWEHGLAAYLTQGGDISLKTCDYLTSIVGCGLCVVGGRSVLHVAATNLGKRTDIFDALCARYPGLEEVPDLNGAFPRTLLGYRDKAMTEFKAVLARNPVKIIDLRTEFKAVLARHPVKTMDLRELQSETVTHLPGGERMDAGVRLFSVRADFIKQLEEGVSAAPVNIPNSMHRYGKVLLPFMDGPVRALCASVLPEHALGRVKHIHAFSVKYSHSPGIQQTHLGRHRDDSDFTINVCLSNDSRGANLVFDTSGFVYTHKAGRGMIHTGDLEHHVDELETGDRECIIIWVRLSKPSSPACSSNKD